MSRIAVSAVGKCGNCQTTLQSDGTCEVCDRRPRQLEWWQELDIEWEATLIVLNQLPSGVT